MKGMKLVLVCAIFIVLLAGGAFAQGTNIKTASKEGIGNYLTDDKGMTLYFYKKDSKDKSACAGDCAARWPIFYVEKASVAGKKLKAKEFATITREDGKKQTTFRGWPLYYFAQDKLAGDTVGQARSDVWYVVDPAAFMKKK